MEDAQRSSLYWVLAFSCAFLFLGKGLEFIWWDGPFRSLFWDEDIMKPVIQGVFGISWEQYAQSSALYFRTLTILTGMLFLLATPAPFLTGRKVARIALRIMMVLYGFLAFLYFKESSFRIGTLMEYSTQVLTPLILILFVNDRSSKAGKWAVIAVILTFSGHAMYAIGIHPVPGSFTDMVIQGFGVNEPTANHALLWFGILDLLACILLFNRRTRKAALVYMVLWGGVTALARTYSHFMMEFPVNTLVQWVPHTLYRIPHAGIPLFLLLIDRRSSIP